jgi:hypothetical protein
MQKIFLPSNEQYVLMFSVGFSVAAAKRGETSSILPLDICLSFKLLEMSEEGRGNGK